MLSLNMIFQWFFMFDIFFFFIRDFQFVLEGWNWHWSWCWCSIELGDMLAVFKCILANFDSILWISAKFAKFLNNLRSELSGFNFMLLRHLKRTLFYGFVSIFMFHNITCDSRHPKFLRRVIRIEPCRFQQVWPVHTSKCSSRLTLLYCWLYVSKLTSGVELIE